MIDRPTSADNPYTAPDPSFQVTDGQRVQTRSGGVLFIDYEMMLDDLIGFSLYYHQQRQKAEAKPSKVILVLLLSMLIPFFLLVFRFVTSELLFGLLIGLSLFVVIFILLVFKARNNLRKQLTRMYTEGENVGMLGLHRIVIDPEELTFISEGRHSKAIWGVVEKIEETETAIYVYITSYNAVVLPKRAFAEPAELQTFVQTAQEYLQGIAMAELA